MPDLRAQLFRHLCALALWSLAATCLTGSAAAAPSSPDDYAGARARSNPGEAKGTAAKEETEKPFADVIKDATAVEGLFTLYRKDEQTWLELSPEQLDVDFLCSPTLESGLGERGMLSAQVLEEFVFRFRRQGKSIQLVKRNVRYRAAPGSPIGRAVERSFTDSIVASGKVASLPHPDRNSVLVALDDYFLGDLSLAGYYLGATYRWPYRLDKDNSSFGGLKAFPENVNIEAKLSFTLDQLPMPPMGPEPPNAPAPPLAPPDARGVQLKLRYDLSRLPASSYKPRFADDRVGHFLALFQDYDDDTRETPYVRYVTRWNLEKQDPYAPLSLPKKPIVFWLENAIPVKYRQAVADGVLIWNQAFEAIGFKDAIVVKQQPDDADWDPADVRYNTIRWFISTDSAFAIGPSRINPYTGEIYDADISFAEAMTRFTHRNYDDWIAPRGILAAEPAAAAWLPLNERALCGLGEGAVLEAAFGLSALDARGELATPEAEAAYVRDYLVHVTAHEVGHTLGLRHNFRASTLHPTAALQDADLTTAKGLTGSVMDYTPVNLAPAGKTRGQYWQTTLGPYDMWAIEYAYKPLASGSPEAELESLRAIAGRVAEPELAYGTDEDGFGLSPKGIDPRTNMWDLGGDPLQFYQERVGIVREIWAGLEQNSARSGQGYQRLRRGFDRGFVELSRALYNATKYVGGVHHHRDHVGDPGGRPPYVPVTAAEQRQALSLVLREGFAADAFAVPPSLLNSLAIERHWTFEGETWTTPRNDYPLHDRVLAVQSLLLDLLLDPLRLGRLQDNPARHADPKQAFTLADLFGELRQSLWSELEAARPAAINSFRRAAQQAHLDRLARLALQAGGVPADASTLARHDLSEILSRARRALAAKGTRDTLTRAHLEEVVARADAALKAELPRSLR